MIAITLNCNGLEMSKRKEGMEESAMVKCIMFSVVYFKTDASASIPSHAVQFDIGQDILLS